MTDPIIIIGTGLAGYNLAREFRKYDQETPLVLLSQDAGDFYSKPLLSTALMQNKTPEALSMSSADAMATELQADIRTHTQVLSIDTQAKTISTANEVMIYSRLVLAVGASVKTCGWAKGKDFVCAVNDLEDYTVFRRQIEGKKRIAIIGAGLVGCEFANDLVQLGFEVDVIALSKTPLDLLLPQEVGSVLQAALAKAGVQWHLEQGISSLEKNGDQCEICLTSGQKIVTDVILSAVGITPNVALAKGAGLAVRQGIVVDRLLQTSAKDVYALGDCAEVAGLNLHYVNPLLIGARALAKTLSGEATAVVYPPMPVSIKTSLCPVIVSAPGLLDKAGEWQVDIDTKNVKALFYDYNKVLQGFALLGEATKERMVLLKQLPPLFEE